MDDREDLVYQAKLAEQAERYDGVASAAPKLDGSLEAQWHWWKATHGKVYGPNEEGWRRTVWEKNKKMVDLHNQEYKLGRKSYTLGMNAFSDMTNEEFTQLMLKPEVQEKDSVPETRC